MKIFIAIVALFFSSSSFAKSFRVDLKVSISGENIQEVDTKKVRKELWKVEKDEWDEDVFVTSFEVHESKLPYQKILNEFTFSISKQGEIFLGVSIGDADSSSDGLFIWPSDKKSFLILPSPIELKVSGGEHASSAWNFAGEAKVVVVDDTN